MYQNILEQLGLTKNESLVYQALLKLGRSPIGPILKETKLKRGNAYKILYSLVDKKLISQFEKDKKTYFQIEPPINLQNLIDIKERSLEQIKKSLANIIPSLESDYRLTTEKPTVQYFEGIEGIKKIFQDTLKQSKEILIFRSIYDNQRISEYLDKYYVPKRASLSIKTRIISSAKITPQKLKKDKLYLRKRKFVSEKIFSLPTQIDIYQNKVSFISYRRKLIGVIIENEDLAETMRKIFNLIWNLTS